MAFVNLDLIQEVVETHDVQINNKTYKVSTFTTEENYSHDSKMQQLGDVNGRLDLLYSEIAAKFNNTEITGEFLKQNLEYLKIFALYRILIGEGFSKEQYEDKIKNAIKIALNKKE